MNQINHSIKPFNVIVTEEGCKITVGNNVVAEQLFETYDEAVAYIESKPYELLVTLMCLCCEMIIKNFNNEEQCKEQ